MIVELVAVTGAVLAIFAASCVAFARATPKLTRIVIIRRDGEKVTIEGGVIHGFAIRGAALQVDYSPTDTGESQ